MHQHIQYFYSHESYPTPSRFSIELLPKVQSYKQQHCWQYDIRIRNYLEDLKEVGLSKSEVSDLRIRDFEFRFVPKENKQACTEIQNFIKHHEWLGKMPKRPTHRFIATYQGCIAGVIVMATPNSFSNLLGKEKNNLEKLISRGACISWSPKNLGSALVMFSIRWMVKNTCFRLFTAYSDTEAKELGTIYQACNFIYLGQNFGANKEFFDPLHPERGWFSDRIFRKHSQVKRYARGLGVPWQISWSTTDKTLWEKITREIKEKLKAQARAHRERCLVRSLLPKHKYAYIMGRTKAESKRLKSLFEIQNPNLLNLAYPKQRGPQTDTADNFIKPKEKILTKAPTAFRPQEAAKNFEYLTASETSKLLGVSVWTVYKLITSDPTFPAHNIGVKKKWAVRMNDLDIWTESRTRKRILEKQMLPTGQDLLKLAGG